MSDFVNCPFSTRSNDSMSRPEGIHKDELHVLLGIEVAEADEESIIIDIQTLTHLLVFSLFFRFIGVKFLIGITEGDYTGQPFLSAPYSDPTA